MARAETYELHVARRDGRQLRHDVQPVTVRMDLRDQREVDAVIAEHYVVMAAAAEGERWRDHWKPTDPHVREWLPAYQIEVHEPGSSPRFRSDPVLTSTSTEGWSPSRFR